MLDHHAISTRIKHLRDHLSQKDFAKKIGCKQAYISEVETLRTKVSLEFVCALSEMSGKSTDWILLGKEESGMRGVLTSVEISAKQLSDFIASREALRLYIVKENDTESTPIGPEAQAS